VGFVVFPGAPVVSVSDNGSCTLSLFIEIFLRHGGDGAICEVHGMRAGPSLGSVVRFSLVMRSVQLTGFHD